MAGQPENKASTSDLFEAMVREDDDEKRTVLRERYVAAVRQEIREGMRRQFGRRRWRVSLGLLPQALVAIAGLVCAVIAWPSDLAWGCLAVAGGAVLAMFSVDLEFE